MYVVTVEFEIDPIYVESFRVAMLEQAENSLRNEAGCQQFDVCFDPDRETFCFLYEKYDNRQAFDEHLQTQHFRNFDAIVRPWITNKTVRTFEEGVCCDLQPTSKLENTPENK